MPPRNATGTNTALRMRAMAITGPETSSMARIVASRGLIRSSSMCRWTASTTTIASSTTIPMARTSAKSVVMLIVRPNG